MGLRARQAEETSPARRSTVRIVRPRTIPRATLVNVIVAALAAVGLFFVWHAWQSDQAEPPYRRSLGDTLLEYKCEAGHTWTATGRVEPRLCTSCGLPAHPVGNFWCQEHGTFEVAARYVQDPGGAPHLSHLRLAGHDWVAAETGVHCPECDRRLVRRREDPLAENARGRKGKGG